ncbi:MAG: hypothetical protein QW728_07325 [Thermoplasmata archaeon]
MDHNKRIFTFKITTTHSEEKVEKGPPETMLQHNSSSKQSDEKLLHNSGQDSTDATKNMAITERNPDTSPKESENTAKDTSSYITTMTQVYIEDSNWADFYLKLFDDPSKIKKVPYYQNVERRTPESVAEQFCTTREALLDAIVNSRNEGIAFLKDGKIRWNRKKYTAFRKWAQWNLEVDDYSYVLARQAVFHNYIFDIDGERNEAKILGTINEDIGTSS